jgi:hypothetical protein
MRTGKKLLASAGMGAGALALVVTSLGAAQASNFAGRGGFGEVKRGGLSHWHDLGRQAPDTFATVTSKG